MAPVRTVEVRVPGGAGKEGNVEIFILENEKNGVTPNHLSLKTALLPKRKNVKPHAVGHHARVGRRAQ